MEPLTQEHTLMDGSDPSKKFTNPVAAGHDCTLGGVVLEEAASVPADQLLAVTTATTATTAPAIEPQISRLKASAELLDQAVYLILFGQLGLTCRFWLGTSCANRSLGPGLTLCGVFPDLASNILGSFFLGIACDGKTVIKSTLENLPRNIEPK